MSSLLANKVVIGMNWSGQYGKKAFGSLKLAQVVTGMPRFSHLQYFLVLFQVMVTIMQNVQIFLKGGMA